jgi:hypothetical protein
VESGEKGAGPPLMRDTELDQLNASLKSEADIILHERGLLDTLGRHGTPTVVGSYAMNTMTWADLDIYVICDSPEVGAFFELGRDIEDCVKAGWMSYRNSFIGKWPDLPQGLYWGVRTSHGLPRQWKIDIWCIDPTQAQELIEFQAALQARITPESRQTILQIKSHFCTHPKYRSGFHSMDIYNAVLDGGVSSVAEFEKVLREKEIEV